jgi:hypothetical protein
MRADGKLLFGRLIANSAFFMLAACAFVYYREGAMEAIKPEEENGATG